MSTSLKSINAVVLKARADVVKYSMLLYKRRLDKHSTAALKKSCFSFRYKHWVS